MRLAGTPFKPVTRWIVQGETLRIKIGNAQVLIEHGNLFDKFNRVDHNGLRELSSLVNRGFSVNPENYYDPPFGSRIVLEHVAPIRGEFPWLDYLQPGAEAVYPLMREFTSIKQKASFLKTIQEALWTVSKDELTKFRAYKNPAVAFRGSDGDEDFFQEWLSLEIKNQSEKRGLLVKATDIELIRELISNKKEVFSINTPDYSYESVAILLEHGASLVITGHTHKAKIYAVGKGLYINTGTWAQLLETPGRDESEAVWQKFIDNLRKGSGWEDNSFSRPTFASVEFDSDRMLTTASLMEWKDLEPKVLSKWVWDTQTSQWEES